MHAWNDEVERILMRVATLDESAVKVAVVDDDDQLRERVLVPGLRDYGFQVAGFASAAELYRVMLGEPFDVVLLDINLPGENGIAVADYLRSIQSRLGILMLSAQHDESYKVESLSKGADGYLEKPTSIKVIAAMLHSLTRRISLKSRPAKEKPKTESSDDGSTNGWYLTAPDGAIIALSVTEQRLFKALRESEGEPVSREALIAAIADDVYSFDASHLDMIVHRLRKKLAESRQSGLQIVTIRGLGYALKKA